MSSDEDEKKKIKIAVGSFSFLVFEHLQAEDDHVAILQQSIFSCFNATTGMIIGDTSTLLNAEKCY